MLFGVLFCNCKGTKKSAKESQDVKKSGDIVLFTKPLDSLNTDYFDIDSISMKDQTLMVYVTYGGGCGNVEFDMFYKPQILTVMPHRKTLYLKLTDNDPCRELVQKELLYDLSVFNDEARKGGVIIILDKYEFLYSLSEQ